MITLASPGVVADSNGFFHPIGDHAQTQFSIDNQPVTDQQSRVYSNQISPDAVQSMEVITGVAPAEYGDKSSLDRPHRHEVGARSAEADRQRVVRATDRSGRRPCDVNIGGGSHTVGDFRVGERRCGRDRFLDPPEFAGDARRRKQVSFFDRLDAHPERHGTFHLNVQAARSAFDVPNTLDAAASARRSIRTSTRSTSRPAIRR